MKTKIILIIIGISLLMSITHVSAGPAQGTITDTKMSITPTSVEDGNTIVVSVTYSCTADANEDYTLWLTEDTITVDTSCDGNDFVYTSTDLTDCLGMGACTDNNDGTVFFDNCKSDTPIVNWTLTACNVDADNDFATAGSTSTSATVDLDNTVLNIEITAAVDNDPPEVIVVFPTNNAIYSGSSIDFNLSVTDSTGIDSCLYSLNSGVNNYTITNSSTSDWGATNSSIGDGSYTANFYCNDTLGYLNSSESVSFTIDGTSPSISFGDGTPDDSSSQSNPDIFVNLSTSDSNLHYAFTDFDNDLYLWLRMDEINGATVYDNSSYDNHGTAIGDAVQIDSGKFGRGFEFDGVNEANPDMINITGMKGNSPVFNTSFSVSVWIKADVADTLLIIGTTSQSSIDGWSLRTAGGGDVFRFEGQGINSTGTSSYGLAESVESVQPGVWTMVTGIYNASVPDLKLYVNGSLRSTSTTNITDAGYANNWDLGVGYIDDSTRVFDGIIDEVLIFNRSLSAIEIAALYNATSTQYTNNFTDLSQTSHSFTGYAIDAAGNVNSATRSVTIEGTSDTCTAPGSGNWRITCSDNCVWDSPILVPENITMIGNGILTLNSNMNFVNEKWRIVKEDGCIFAIGSGGRIT